MMIMLHYVKRNYIINVFFPPFHQGMNCMDACKALGVNHVVYSGLDPVNELIGQQCSHFDGKAEVENYIKEISKGKILMSKTKSFYFS